MNHYVVNIIPFYATQHFLKLKFSHWKHLESRVNANWFENILAKLDTLYLEDVLCSHHKAYEKLEKFTRPSHMLIGGYIIEFE